MTQKITNESTRITGVPQIQQRDAVSVERLADVTQDGKSYSHRWVGGRILYSRDGPPHLFLVPDEQIRARSG